MPPHPAHERKKNDGQNPFSLKKFHEIWVGFLNLFLLLALLLLLEHLLDNLLLLDQEGTDDPVPHAVTASGSAIGSLDSLLGLGDLGVLARSESGDLEK